MYEKGKGILTESVRVLHPVPAPRRFGARCVRVDVLEDHVCSVHDVDAPELRLEDVEVFDAHRGDVPELEGYGPAWSGGSWGL